MKRTTAIVVLVLVVLAALLVLRRCSGPGEESFQTAPVTRGPMTQAVTATGTLNPVVNVQVGSQVSGNIAKLFADFNSQVKAGQVVAQIDPAIFQATVTQAEGGKSHEPDPMQLLGTNHRERKLDPFVKKQKEKLLQLRDAMVDSMAGVAQDTLRSRAEGSEASAFGMHQADAGSDAYDRDFALSLLSQEQDALYEIDQALKRIEMGTYGVCEMSGKQIPKARLEAIPFARFTVECQSQLEKQNKASRVRQSVTSLFGLTEDEGGETEEEEPAQTEAKE